MGSTIGVEDRRERLQERKRQRPCRVRRGSPQVVGKQEGRWLRHAHKAAASPSPSPARQGV